MRKYHGLFTAMLIVATILLAFPKTAFADGNGMEKEVNGYHVKLTFLETAKVGENQFHVQIIDAMGLPVTNAEVEVSAMPVEGMDMHDSEMEAEAPSIGVMTNNNSMDGMDTTTEEPVTGVMKPNASETDGHAEEAVSITLEPSEESGEYKGELHFDISGEWMFNVHFTINGQTNQVEFPFDVARLLSMNYGILAAFFGFNAAVITAAAILKRKTVAVRK